MPLAEIPAVPVSAGTPIARRLPQPGFWLAMAATVLLTFLQLALGVAGAIVLVVFNQVIHQGEPTPEQLARLLLPLGTLTTMAVAVASAVLIHGRQSSRALALRPVAWPHVLLILLATGPFLIVAEAFADWSTEYLPSFSDTMFDDFSSLPIAVVLIFGAVLPAIGEEIIYRGLIGRGLVARYGLVLGGLLTALLFGLVHVDPAQAVSVIWLGWVLQAVYVATRSLAAPMLIHLLNNALAFTQMKFYNPLEDLEHVPLPLLLSAVVALVGIGVVFYQMRSRWLLADGTPWTPGYVSAEMPPAHVAAECRWSWPGLAAVALAIATSAAFWGLASMSI